MQELIFWRHGQAGSAMTDLARELTLEGQRQAQRTAMWLRERDVDFPIISSQAIRTQQTATFYRQPYKMAEELNPGQHFLSVLTFIENEQQPHLIVVGHQPWIGQMLAYLLTGQANYYAMETSELWWLKYENNKRWMLNHKITSNSIGY